MWIRIKYLLFLMLLASSSWAATVCVKKIDSIVYFESGTSSCRDVTAADTSGDVQDGITAAGSDTCYICEGTYSGADLDAVNGYIRPGSGVTIEAFGTVVLDADGGNRAVIANGDDNWTLKGFKVTGGTQTGIQISNAASGWTVEDCEVYENTSRGIQIDGNDNTVTGTIRDCSVHDNGTAETSSYGITISECPSATIRIEGTEQGLCQVYQNGYFSNTDGMGIYVGAGTTGVTIDTCDVYQNGSGYGSNFEVLGGEVTVKNCFGWGAHDVAELKGSADDAASITLLGNILIGRVITGQDDASYEECTVTLINNTIIVDDQECCLEIMGPNYQVQNNIFVLNESKTYGSEAEIVLFRRMSAADIASGTLDHNYSYAPTSGDLYAKDLDEEIKYANIAAFQVDYSSLCEGSTFSVTNSPDL